MKTKEQFVAAVVADYKKGVENAYEAFIESGYSKQADESDLEFVKRCLEQDYHDADHGGCMYADYLQDTP